jgi:hypothetical protein
MVIMIAITIRASSPMPHRALIIIIMVVEDESAWCCIEVAVAGLEIVSC